MSEACETPLLDLLRNIPADARLIYDHSQFESQSIPIGVLAKKCVDEIFRLTAERDEARTEWIATVEHLKQNVLAYKDKTDALQGQVAALRATLEIAEPFVTSQADK